MKLRLLVCLILFISFSISAQRQDCAISLEQARTNFNQGKLYGIPSMLKPCLDNGFNKTQRIESYLLLTRTYLLIDDPISAEDSYLKLLELDPEFEVDPANDPLDIVYLSEKFTTTPVFILFVRGGLTYSFATELQNFGTDNTSLSAEEYLPSFGLNFGAGAEWNINDHLSLGLETNFLTRRYEYNNSLFNGDKQQFIENQSVVAAPIYLKYRTRIKKFYPFVYAGFALDFTLAANAELELVDQIGTGENRSEFSVTGPQENLIDLRNRLNRSIVAGIGSSFRFGYNYIFVDIRYFHGISNIVKQGAQYDNPNLQYRYGYVDDLKSLQSAMINVGWIKPLYNPRKKSDKKPLFQFLKK